MRLIGQDGEQLGIVWLREAIEAAEEVGQDLIEVAPESKPPVCRIMDWGRYRYEQKQREREQRRKQRTGEVKSLRLRPSTDDHDFGVTKRKAEAFLREGHKVRVEVRFRGREITHRELGQQILMKLAEEVSELAELEQSAAMEGRKMFIMVAPLAEVVKAAEQRRAQAEERGEKLVEEPDQEDLDDDDDNDETEAEVTADEPSKPADGDAEPAAAATVAEDSAPAADATAEAEPAEATDDAASDADEPEAEPEDGSDD